MADQKLKKDAGKLRYDLISQEMIDALAEVFTFGLKNGYGEESWREVEQYRYIGAEGRHNSEWRHDGQAKDKDSGLLAIKHKFWTWVC